MATTRSVVARPRGRDTQLLNGSTTPPDIVGFLNRTGLAASIARTTEVNADTILTQYFAIWVATGLQPTGIVCIRTTGKRS